MWGDSHGGLIVAVHRGGYLFEKNASKATISVAISSSILIVNIQMSDRANRVSSRDQDTTFFWKGSKPLFTCSSRIDKNQLGLAKNGKIEGADLYW